MQLIACEQAICTCPWSQCCQSPANLESSPAMTFAVATLKILCVWQMGKSAAAPHAVANGTLQTTQSQIASYTRSTPCQTAATSSALL